jgi:hypothetical protein
MPNVGLIVRLDIALAAIWKLKLLLKQQVWASLLWIVLLVFVAVFGFKHKLVVVTAYGTGYCFGVKVHDDGLRVQRLAYRRASARPVQLKLYTALPDCRTSAAVKDREHN